LSLGPLAGIIPIFLVTATTLALETSLSGRWKVLVDPDNAKRDYFLELKQEGNKVSGALISPRSGKYPFDGGSFAEGKLRFKVERKREETTQVLTVEAALKDGKLEGTVDIDGASLPVLITRAGSPVAGKWNAVSKSPQGQEHPSTLELAEDAGGALKGKSTGAQGTIDLESVSFDGEKFTFEIVLPIQGNNVPFVVNATLKDANTLSGRWKTKDADISGEWSATREAAKPAAPHAPVEVAKGLAGKWYAVSVLPGQKKMNLQLEIELDGDKVKGKVHMPKQSLEIQNGKASGSKVELSVTYRDDSGEVTVKLEGELKPDDEVLSGKWSSGRGEQGEWSGRKRTEL
jgi:hypothetical protein